MSIRTRTQGRYLAGRLEKEKEFKTKVAKYVKPGRIVEFGCSSGVVLSILSEQFPESSIVGLDISEALLELANNKKLSNITLVKADAAQKIFKDGIFDTALFIHTLHEIYSFEGMDKFLASLTNAYKILKKTGILIICDFIKPKPRSIRIRFKNKGAEEKFKKFTKEFKIRQIDYKSTGEWLELDLADCLEFLTKYQHQNAEWKTELKEAHFFITLSELNNILNGIGFEIEKAEEHLESKKYWEEKLRDVAVSFELFKQPKSYIIKASKREQ